MANVLQTLANFFYRYGEYGAGLTSLHGGHEVPVPEVLRELDVEEKP